MTSSSPRRLETPALGTGKMLGRYELLQRIGAGGMAEVFLAVRHGAAGFRKAVALKRILPPFAKQSEFLRLLSREAGIAAMMHHPNCVQVNELEEIDGQFVVSMELLFGAVLSELLDLAEAKRERLPIGIAVRVAADAARGLHYVHELDDGAGHRFGIVHRDVSPQNLMLTEDGVTKVLDFGIATAAEGLDSDTRTGIIKGKYHYVSPEQVKLKPLDARTDVWALGATLFELLVGEPLFGAQPSAADTLQAVLEAPIRRPSELRADVPPLLDDVVRDALQRDPLLRTPSAAAFADMLDRLATRLPGCTPGDAGRYVRALAGARIDKLKSAAAAHARVRDPKLASSGSQPAPTPSSGLTPLDPPSKPTVAERLTGPLLGAAPSLSSVAPSLATAVVEPTSGAAASVAPPSAIDAPTPAAAAAIERPASPFAATLEKAVARAEQRTELIDVRKRSKKRRPSIVLEVVLFVLALVVGWLAAWWLVG
ncbi:MAG: serine/threonine protein kinase [Deltaproteobacteria bacterium]|nr:serine/threonine protein kinase [Deltaproteobacteria bacterium]